MKRYTSQRPAASSGIVGELEHRTTRRDQRGQRVAAFVAIFSGSALRVGHAPSAAVGVVFVADGVGHAGVAGFDHAVGGVIAAGVDDGWVGGAHQVAVGIVGELVAGIVRIDSR